MNYYFIMDELTNILKESKSQSTIELTNIHYAEMLLPYLKHYHLESLWRKFINRSPKRRILEEAITLMAQWFQPMEDISYSQIETKLDNITQQVIERLKIKRPFHPILSASHEQFSYWKCNNINENQWDDKDTKQALDIVCEVLVELGFLLGGYPMNTNSYLNYHLINLVLDTKHGCQVMLKIILQSVARRLGIRCDLRSYLKTQSHDCVLFWKPKSGIRNCNDACFVITLQQGKIILIENSVEIIESLQPINLVLFLLKWVKYIPKYTFHDVTGFRLIFWLREFQMLMKPDLKVIKRLVQHYFYQKKDPSIFISPLRKIKRSSDLSTMVQAMTILIDIQWNKYSLALFREEHKYMCKPKKRDANIKFAVGMIVEVRPQGFTGVIIEWEQKNLDRLDIPTSNIYTVLADNKLHYVSEVKLILIILQIV
ncbi:hypothetical protein HN011_005432 [Eciton burchellii]|nr:hypothetical protein HN011_005432 [Eciton burchellii]